MITESAAVLLPPEKDFRTNATSAAAEIFKTKNFDLLSEIEESLHREVALRLIKAERGAAVVTNLEKFNNLALDNEIALEFIKAGQGLFVANNLDKFQDLDAETAFELYKAGHQVVVVSNAKKFGLTSKAVNDSWRLPAYHDQELEEFVKAFTKNQA